MKTDTLYAETQSTVSFYAPTKFSRYVQLAVMKHNGRFERNPYEMFNNDSRFEISFGDVQDLNKFMARVHILNQPWM